MPTKKNQSQKAFGIPVRTWIFFGIFLIVAYYCFKVIYTEQQMTSSIVIPAPVSVVIPTKTPTTVHKTVVKTVKK